MYRLKRFGQSFALSRWCAKRVKSRVGPNKRNREIIQFPVTSFPLLTVAMSQDQDVEQRSLHCAIVGLPAELLCEQILSHLTANSLAYVEMSCRFFRFGTARAASLPEQAAYRKLTASCGNAETQHFQ